MEHDDQDHPPAPAAAPPKNLKKVTPAGAEESSSERGACGIADRQLDQGDTRVECHIPRRIADSL